MNSQVLINKVDDIIRQGQMGMDKNIISDSKGEASNEISNDE